LVEGATSPVARRACCALAGGVGLALFHRLRRRGRCQQAQADAHILLRRRQQRRRNTQCTNSSKGNRCRPMLMAIACQCWPRSLIVQHPQQVGIGRIDGFTGEANAITSAAYPAGR
jgi:hypothetical protein